MRQCCNWQYAWHHVSAWTYTPVVCPQDGQNERVYHHEYWTLHKRQKDEVHVVAFTIPIFEPLPPQYFLRAVSDRWVSCESVIPLSFQHLILPDRHPPHTDLLDLGPLPKTALNNPAYEAM
jgi:hypothetical protein